MDGNEIDRTPPNRSNILAVNYKKLKKTFARSTHFNIVLQQSMRAFTVALGKFKGVVDSCKRVVMFGVGVDSISFICIYMYAYFRSLASELAWRRTERLTRSHDITRRRNHRTSGGNQKSKPDR